MSNENARGLIQIIQDTPAPQIASLEVVKKKFIANFNACHKGNIGDLMYHRQLIYFNQQIAGNEKLKAADSFSLYACFVTAAVKNYSFDPADNEVYIIPYKGKAALQPQAGAYVKRLIETNQIAFADQAKLVYEGDLFKVSGGRVKEHEENFQTEKIIAAYIRFVIDETGNDRFFVYRPSDWQQWRQKSQVPDGPNWTGGINGQPNAGFLRTKIVLHACKEKCWAIGQRPPGVDQFENVIVEDADEVVVTTNAKEEKPAAAAKQIEKPPAAAPPIIDDEFPKSNSSEAGVKINDEDNF